MVAGMTNLTDHLRQTAEAEQAEQDLDAARRQMEREEAIRSGITRLVMSQLIEWGFTNDEGADLAELLGHDPDIELHLDRAHPHADVWLDGYLRFRIRPRTPRDPAAEWSAAYLFPVKLCPACGALAPPAGVKPQPFWYAWQVTRALSQPIEEHDVPGGIERCDGNLQWLKLPPEPKPLHRVALVLTPEALEETINELAQAGYWTPAGVTPTPEGTLVVATYNPCLVIDEEPF